MITGYDPEARTLSAGIGSLLQIGRLPETLVPPDTRLGLRRRQAVHNAYQKAMEEEGWEREVTVQNSFIHGGISYRIRGRIDLLRDSGESCIVREVKTVRELPPDPVPAMENAVLQLLFYCLAYTSQRDSGLKGVKAELVLIPLSAGDPRPHITELDITGEEITRLWRRRLDRISGMILQEDLRRQEQLRALQNFEFPYPRFRAGQERIMKTVSNCLEEDRKLLLQAPTGTGKTAAVIAGAIPHAVAKRKVLFFLTAKNTHRAMVEETLKLIAVRGLVLRSIFLAARASLCHRGRKRCLPDDCPYAQDFRRKVEESGIMERLLNSPAVVPSDLADAAGESGVCAFELGLCLSTSCDVVVCDYNYVFDPHVFLRRFFLEHETSSMCTLLIDETANLPGRATDYLSPCIHLSWLTSLRERSGIPAGIRRLLKPWLSGFGEWIALLRSSGEDEIELPGDTVLPENADAFIEGIELLRDPPEELRELVRAVNDFKGVAPGPTHRLLFRREGNDHVLQWFCLDPSGHLRDRMDSCGGTVAFSATVSPFTHFMPLLGMDDERTAAVKLPYPFPEENLGVWIDPSVDTRYRSREASSRGMAGTMVRIYREVGGSWLVFLPSYAYLSLLARKLEPLNVPFSAQQRDMSAGQRKDFISSIEGSDGLYLAVSGGIFAEGVDLKSERLSGAMVVGPSLPSLNLRRKLLRKRYDSLGLDGFIHSMSVPGMVRVVQAAGRLIRNEDQRRALILFGRRFTHRRYLELMPGHWFSRGSIPLLGRDASGPAEFFGGRKKGGA